MTGFRRVLFRSITVPIDFENGLSHELAAETAKKLGFETANVDKAADIFVKLYKLFKEKDATQIEINPLAEVEGGDVLCMDAKLGFDENAEFRQEVRGEGVFGRNSAGANAFWVPTRRPSSASAT